MKTTGPMQSLHTHLCKGWQHGIHTYKPNWIKVVKQFSISKSIVSACVYKIVMLRVYHEKENIFEQKQPYWPPIMQHFTPSLCASTLSPLCQASLFLLIDIIQTCLSMKSSNIHPALCILWGIIWILTSKGFQSLSEMYILLNSWAFKCWTYQLHKKLKIHMSLKIRNIIFVRAWIQERCLTKYDGHKCCWGILLFIYFGSPKVYKIMTAAKDMTFWFHLIWRETTAEGSSWGSQIKYIGEQCNKKEDNATLLHLQQPIISLNVQ